MSLTTIRKVQPILTTILPSAERVTMVLKGFDDNSLHESFMAQSRADFPAHIQNLPTTSFHSHVEIVAPTSPSFRRTAAHTKAELKFAN